MFNVSANRLAKAIKKPTAPQNPNARMGTVVSTFIAENKIGTTVPVIFDGETTAVNVQAGTHAFANDRVGLTRRGNTWAIEANYTTPKVVIGKTKRFNTSRTGTNAATPDTDVSLNLIPGTWLVEIDFVWSAGNTGKLATSWIVPADTLAGVRQTMGPGQTSASGLNRGDGSTSRWGSHLWTTTIAYAGSGDGVYMTHREWGSITTATGGAVTLGWSRFASDTPATWLYDATTIRATRLN